MQTVSVSSVKRSADANSHRSDESVEESVERERWIKRNVGELSQKELDSSNNSWLDLYQANESSETESDCYCTYTRYCLCFS